jgi:hypothetical protein
LGQGCAWNGTRARAELDHAKVSGAQTQHTPSGLIRASTKHSAGSARSSGAFPYEHPRLGTPGPLRSAPRTSDQPATLDIPNAHAAVVARGEQHTCVGRVRRHAQDVMLVALQGVQVGATLPIPHLGTAKGSVGSVTIAAPPGGVPCLQLAAEQRHENVAVVAGP